VPRHGFAHVAADIARPLSTLSVLLPAVARHDR
jgi:hypothetical protein